MGHPTGRTVRLLSAAAPVDPTTAAVGRGVAVAGQIRVVAVDVAVHAVGRPTVGGSVVRPIAVMRRMVAVAAGMVGSAVTVVLRLCHGR